MKRRLGLARVTLGRLPLLLLDEPFTGLDRHGQKWLVEFLLAFKAAGAPWSSPRIASVAGSAVADRVVILAGGRVLLDRAVAELPIDELHRVYDAVVESGRAVMAYARRTWIVLWKDLLVERRSKESLNALLFFALLLLFLFQFALGPDRERLARGAARAPLARLRPRGPRSGSGGASSRSGTTTAGTDSGSRPATSRRSISASWPPTWW